MPVGGLLTCLPPVRSAWHELLADRCPSTASLNWAIQVVAISQLRHDSAGRDFYDHKVAEGKSSREAIRALKRRLSDVVYRKRVRLAAP